MEGQTEPRWEGKVSVELKVLTANQVWPFLADFCNLHKWLPGVDTCYRVEGEFGKPGLIRFCSSSSLSSGGSQDETKIMWAKEKLLLINPTERCLSYEILENNAGFKSYVATMKVLPVNDQHGCQIEWSFIADPITGWGNEEFASYLNSSLQFMARKVEQALLSG